MLQPCICRDIEHLGSLESTHVTFGVTLTPLSCSPNFLSTHYFDIYTLVHTLSVKCGGDQTPAYICIWRFDCNIQLMNVSWKFHTNRNTTNSIKFKMKVQELKAYNTFTLNFPLQALIYMHTSIHT